jgi:hypothetical protein
MPNADNFRNVDPPGRRIISVEVKRETDTDPDLSHFGEYARHGDAPFSIDRNERGDRGLGELEFFHPGTVEPYDPKASWIPKRIRNKERYWRRAMEKNAEADYARMESYNKGDWCMTGISAEARVILSGHTVQKIYSGGLWGIESDSEESYMKEIEEEQLAELREQLQACDFTPNEINAAFKKVKAAS